MSSPNIFLLAVVLAALSVAHADIKPSQVESQLKGLRSVAPNQKPTAVVKLATDIRSLPAGTQKVGYADALSHLVTEGDPGHDALQAVADTLTAALTESPVPAKGDKIPMCLITNSPASSAMRASPPRSRTHCTIEPRRRWQTTKPTSRKLIFTLKDMKNKKVTLSELRGKIVMVNFWATWCGPCRAEMGELDLLQRYFETQGLVVLSITDEDGFKVAQFFGGNKYAPAVVLDPGGKVHQTFHITGIPNTFLFGRDGKLLTVAIDQRTRRQFLEMFNKTDLHP